LNGELKGLRISRIIIYSIVAAAIAGLILAALSVTFKTSVHSEKASPFECGFDPAGVRRIPFCIKFFLVSIIFLVFDVEVTLLLPSLYRSAQVIRLVFILTISTVYE
jgi:NADH:ubiquinone oxidoreductase subunit 3 (subunit A)